MIKQEEDERKDIVGRDDKIKTKTRLVRDIAVKGEVERKSREEEIFSLISKVVGFSFVSV